MRNLGKTEGCIGLFLLLLLLLLSLLLLFFLFLTLLLSVVVVVVVVVGTFVTAATVLPVSVASAVALDSWIPLPQAHTIVILAGLLKEDGKKTNCEKRTNRLHKKYI